MRDAPQVGGTHGRKRARRWQVRSEDEREVAKAQASSAGRGRAAGGRQKVVSKEVHTKTRSLNYR